MSTFLALLPLYLIGNVHCLGMCGPLVMLLGKHKHRHLYFLGRLTSFALVGGAAGALGSVLQVALSPYKVGALLCLGIGVLFVVLSLYFLFGEGALQIRLPKRFEKLSSYLSLLILREGMLPPYLFGLATVLLPCGQTVIVFSACALSMSGEVGLLNGAALALFTTPSLWIAMQARSFLERWKGIESKVLGVSCAFVGVLASLRAFADLGWIHHFIVNEQLHWVLY